MLGGYVYFTFLLSKFNKTFIATDLITSEKHGKIFDEVIAKTIELFSKT
jgi:hypothetical protein